MSDRILHNSRIACAIHFFFFFFFIKLMSVSDICFCNAKLFTVSAFRKVLSIYVFIYFSFGLEGTMWDLIVSVPDHCLSFYFMKLMRKSENCPLRY